MTFCLILDMISKNSVEKNSLKACDIFSHPWCYVSQVLYCFSPRKGDWWLGNMYFCDKYMICICVHIILMNVCFYNMIIKWTHIAANLREDKINWTQFSLNIVDQFLITIVIFKIMRSTNLTQFSCHVVMIIIVIIMIIITIVKIMRSTNLTQFSRTSLIFFTLVNLSPKSTPPFVSNLTNSELLFVIIDNNKKQ